MYITWLGHSCFRLESAGYGLVIDPYRVVAGYPPLRVEANAVYISHHHFDHDCLEAVTLLPGGENPFTVETFSTFHDDCQGALRGDNTVHIFRAEGMTVVHLGDLGCALTAAQEEKNFGLRCADATGGRHLYHRCRCGGGAGGSAAPPRLVLPMHFRRGEQGFPELTTLEDFLSRLPEQPVHRLTEETLDLKSNGTSGIVIFPPPVRENSVRFLSGKCPKTRVGISPSVFVYTEVSGTWKRRAFYMAEKRWRTWETMGLLVVLAAGNLLHFVYDWTGQSPIAAPLAAVNESTWEHMKLFITPWVLWSLVECIALQGHGSPAARPWIGAADGSYGHPSAVLHLSGNFGPGDHVGGCTDFPAGGAAGLLGQLERSGPAGAGRAGVADLRRRDAAGGVGTGHLVDLRTAPAAAVRGSHRRKPGHPTAVGLRVGGDGLQNVISGQGQARRRACLPLPICRIRLPVGRASSGFRRPEGR